MAKLSLSNKTYPWDTLVLLGCCIFYRELSWETACMSIAQEVEEMLRVHKELSCKALLLSRWDWLSSYRVVFLPLQRLDWHSDKQGGRRRGERHSSEGHCEPVQNDLRAISLPLYPQSAKLSRKPGGEGTRGDFSMCTQSFLHQPILEIENQHSFNTFCS